MLRDLGRIGLDHRYYSVNNNIYVWTVPGGIVQTSPLGDLTLGTFRHVLILRSLGLWGYVLTNILCDASI